MATSLTVAVPTAIKIFNWLATLWRGNLWLQAPLLFCLGLHRALHDGRPLRDHAGRLSRRLRGARLVLRRRALPLRALRRHRLRDLRRHLLLVPEDHRPDVRREARQDALLAHVRRLQRGVPPTAHARAAGHAAARLHLRPGRALRVVQPHLDARVLPHGDLAPRSSSGTRRRAGAAARASATTRGARTRSSGTRRRRRRPTTSRRCPTCRARARCATCGAASEGCGSDRARPAPGFD